MIAVILFAFFLHPYRYDSKDNDADDKHHKRPGKCVEERRGLAHALSAKYPSGMKTRSIRLRRSVEERNVQNEMPLEAEYKIIATRLP